MSKKSISKLGIATIVGFSCASVLAALPVKAAEHEKPISQNNEIKKDISKKADIYSDQTEVKDRKDYKTIGEMASHLDKNNDLGIASAFHIFANKTNLGVDTSGNVATKDFTDNVDYGTRGSNTQNNDQVNNSKGDIHYIEHIERLNHGAFRNSHDRVVVGENTKISVNKDRRVVFDRDDQYVESGNLSIDEVSVDNKGHHYIDFDSEFNKLNKKSELWSKTEVSKGVISDFSDQNNRVIDVSNAQTDKNNNIFVNVPAYILNAPQAIKIVGLGNEKSGKQAPVVIVNVISDNGDLVVGTQTKLIYTDNQEQNVGEEHTHKNYVLWNFGTQVKKVDFNSGHFMGSVLAPNAEVRAGVNVDGNIVADVVNIAGGESHRWDLATNNHHPHNRLPDWGFFVPVIHHKDDNKPQPTKPEQPTSPTQASTENGKTKPVVPVIPHGDEEIVEQPTQPKQPTQASQSSTPKEEKPSTQPLQPDTHQEEKPQPSKPKKEDHHKDDKPKHEDLGKPGHDNGKKPQSSTPEHHENEKPSTQPSQPGNHHEEKPQTSKPKKEDHHKDDKQKHEDLGKPGHDNGKKPQSPTPEHHENEKPSTQPSQPGNHHEEKPQTSKPKEEKHHKDDKPKHDDVGKQGDNGKKPQPSTPEHHENEKPSTQLGNHHEEKPQSSKPKEDNHKGDKPKQEDNHKDNKPNPKNDHQDVKPDSEKPDADKHYDDDKTKSSNDNTSVDNSNHSTESTSTQNEKTSSNEKSDTETPKAENSNGRASSAFYPPLAKHGQLGGSSVSQAPNGKKYAKQVGKKRVAARLANNYSRKSVKPDYSDVATVSKNNTQNVFVETTAKMQAKTTRNEGELPQTGEKSNWFLELMGMIISTLSLSWIFSKKRNK